MDAATVRWTAVVRGALGFAALGAGLIHLAFAVGADPGIATGLVTVGALEFLWGGLVVSRPGVPLPRVALGLTLVPTAAWVVLLVVGVDGPRPLPMLAATALGFGIAIGLAAGLRRDPRPEPAHPLVGVAIAGFVVAAVTVPALMATEVTSRLPAPPPHEQPSHG